MHLDTFIQALGREASSKEIQSILTELHLSTPVLGKGKDTVWFEIDETGYDIAFEDESLINGNQYADIGDGELIFMTAYFNKPDEIALPYEITANDTYEDIASKIGRKEDDDYAVLSEKSWIFTKDDGLKYILFFTFSKDYQNIRKLGIVLSYGQLDWVEQLNT